MIKRDEAIGLGLAASFGTAGLLSAISAEESGGARTAVAMSVIAWAIAIVSFAYRRELRRSVSLLPRVWLRAPEILMSIGAAIILVPAALQRPTGPLDLPGLILFSAGLLIHLKRLTSSEARRNG